MCKQKTYRPKIIDSLKIKTANITRIDCTTVFSQQTLRYTKIHFAECRFY